MITEYRALTIEMMPDGGFTVSSPGWRGEMTVTLLAATTIDEALTFIKARIGKHDNSRDTQ